MPIIYNIFSIGLLVSSILEVSHDKCPSCQWLFEPYEDCDLDSNSNAKPQRRK
jgi:hypothetical protein